MTSAPIVAPLPVSYRSMTFLFTDIVSSTEMLTMLGEETWLRELQHHNAIVDRAVTAHGGHAFKFLGDGWMVTFACPRDALAAAQTIQDDVAADPSRHGFRVRIGVHTGNVVEVGDDYVGKDVVLASRITREAGPGEIVVSADVVDALGPDESRFDGGRIAHLKGLGPHLVFGVEAVAALP